MNQLYPSQCSFVESLFSECHMVKINIIFPSPVLRVSGACRRRGPLARQRRQAGTLTWNYMFNSFNHPNIWETWTGLGSNQTSLKLGLNLFEPFCVIRFCLNSGDKPKLLVTILHGKLKRGLSTKALQLACGISFASAHWETQDLVEQPQQGPPFLACDLTWKTWTRVGTMAIHLKSFWTWYLLTPSGHVKTG